MRHHLACTVDRYVQHITCTVERYDLDLDMYILHAQKLVDICPLLGVLAMYCALFAIHTESNWRHYCLLAECALFGTVLATPALVAGVLFICCYLCLLDVAAAPA